MLARRLRRTISRKTSAQRFATATEPPVQMRTVVAVEPGDGTPGSAYATIELDGGGTTPLYPSGGYLPAVGDQVMAIMNGADPVHFATRVMVDGDMQSRTWEGIDGPDAWKMTAAGTLYAVNGYFRGEVEADLFRTGSATEARVEIDSDDYGRGSITFPLPGTAEVAPAMLRADYDDLYDRSWIGLITSDYDGTEPSAAVLLHQTGSDQWVEATGPTGVRVEATTGFVDLDALAGDVRANGVSLTNPPTFHASRATTQSPGIGVWAALTHTTVHHNSGFTVVSGNRYRADVPGRYRATATVEWSGGTYWAGTRLSKNGTGIGGGATPASVDFKGVGHDISNAILGAAQNPVEGFELDGVSDYLQVAVYPSAAGENATMVDLLIEYIGPL